MSFSVVIPARMGSTRLPGKALADIAGLPMVIRVALQAQKSQAADVVVATDHEEIVKACNTHGVAVCLTGSHASGTDRVAEVARLLSWPATTVVVNVQGDEPLIDPALISAVAARVAVGIPMATAAHKINQISEFIDPNVVKVVLDQAQRALYFSRAPIPWHRDGLAHTRTALPPDFAPLRHIGLYAYHNEFLQRLALMAPSPLEEIEALEQLRVLWHGVPISVHVTEHPPGPGVDTQADLDRVRELISPGNMS